MTTIGIVGTAKNTGKTTTLSFILNSLKEKKKIFGVTGIGYDGEEIDNITLLPKPRLYFETETLVATSERCLISAEAQFEIIKSTNIVTSLGKISIVKISKPGLMVVAGPNKKSDLNVIINNFNELNAEFLLIDGSLNRISPMTLVDKLIFTTGGSRNPDIEVLAEEMSLIENIFSFPKLETLNNLLNGKILSKNNIVLADNEKNITLPFGSLLDKKDLEFLVKNFFNGISVLSIPGLISVDLLNKFITAIFNKTTGFSLIINSPMNLLYSSDLSEIKSILLLLNRNNISLNYFEKPQFTALTVNPFYPKPDGSIYITEYLDKSDLLKKMTSRLAAPVYNIMDNGNSLLDYLF